MKIDTALFLILSVFVTGCSSIDVVRRQTVSSIIEDVHESNDMDFRRRVVLTGWVKHGFETSVIFGSRAALDANKYDQSIWLTEPPPVPDTTWEDHSNKRYTYQIFKVTLTGTVRSELRMPIINQFTKTRAEGHMGMSPARLVDIDYSIESDPEFLYFPWKTTPSGHGSPK